MVLMNIAAADADAADLQQHFVPTDLRDRHLSNFDGAGFQVILNYGGQW
jgi:hypothetical protein